MSKFTYVTYIKAAPDEVWRALTDAEAQSQYWFGMRQESDWQEGSPWKRSFADGRLSDIGEILLADAPRRLVIKWRNEFHPELRAEGDGRCTYEIESIGQAVRLTVTHEIPLERSKVIAAVSGGWPRVLSNLKTFLESGKTIPETNPRWQAA